MRKSVPIIDCTTGPDLLEAWPGVAEQVRASPTAVSILAELGDEWVLEGADLDGRCWSIDIDERVLTIDTDGLTRAAIARARHFQNMHVLRIFAGIRAAWQADREEEARDTHRPDLWLLLGRIAEADIAAMTVRMAYEARAEGHEALWRHALGDESGDMAAAFLRAMGRKTGMTAMAAATVDAFTRWFAKDTRVGVADTHTLSDMDSLVHAQTLRDHGGRAQLGIGTVRALTLDPLTGLSYIGALAADLATNPAWRSVSDPVIEAHRLQVLEEVGATRVGDLAMHDRALAARLFPELLVRA